MDLLDRLLGHDAWATRSLLEIAKTLGDERLDREHEFGHKSVRNTLEHVIWNLECWLDLMREVDVRPRAEQPQSVTFMISRQEAVSRELKTFARGIVESGRLDETFLDALDAPPKRKTFGGAIVHLATHGMYHRAQLRIMFRRIGVTDLPADDALTWERNLPTS